MKTFKEYYDQAKRRYLSWKNYQKDEWWKKTTSISQLNPLGDYIETVKFLTMDEKNDSSLFFNHTNVKNSEWTILFDMLGQVLIDWCIENKMNDVCSLGISVQRNVVDGSNVYDCLISAKTYDPEIQLTSNVEDEAGLERFNGCRDFLCDILDQFITKHGKNIPNDWNEFHFSLDSLIDSCDYGEWTCTSDGYMCLSYVNNDGSDPEYTEFVECM